MQQRLPVPERSDQAHQVLTSDEYRVMTLMFCDLEDSTQLSSRLDPEDLSQILRAYQQTAAMAISRFDGYVAQYLGDGLLAYFGYPRAHQEDPVRAVRAGLAIVEQLAELNATLHESFGVSLKLRIGIHTGRVVIGSVGAGERKETLALGQAPNLAARLQSLAASNTVVVSGATRELLGPVVDCEDLGCFELKGVSDPCSVHRVLRVHGRLTSINPRAAALVDRVRELGEIKAAWARARRGEGQCVLLRGEPGIGKSRLVHELLAIADLPEDHALIARGQDDTQMTALQSIREALAASWGLAGLDHDAAFARIVQATGGQRAEDAAWIANALHIRVPERVVLAATTPQVERQRTLAALSRVLLGASVNQPRIMVLEDLHWFDPTSTELLEHLLPAVRDRPMLVLMTARPEYEFQGAHLPQVIEMARLEAADAAALVQAVSRGNTVPAELVERITNRAEGVPLFVEELTKTVLLPSAAHAAPRGQRRPSAPPPDLAIPSTVYGCLMARLDAVSAARQVALMAAVIGRRFSIDLLAESGGFERIALQARLDELVSAEILTVIGEGDRAVYEFKHALLRDAAEQALVKSARRQLHGQVADALARAFPERLEREPELIAQHLSAAGRAEEALPYWRAAGLAAMARFANQEAISHFTQALKAVAELEDPARRTGEELALTVLRAIPMMLTRGWGAPEVGAAYRRARDLCDLVGQEAPPELFPVLIGLGSFFIVTADFREARRIVDQNLAIAERSKLGDLLVEAQTEKGFVELYGGGQPAHALRWLDRAIAAYDPQAHAHHRLTYGRNALAVAWCARSMTSWTLGHLDTAIYDVRQALLAVDALEHPFSRAWAMSTGCCIRLLRGETESARQQVDQLCSFAEAHGFPYWAAQGRVFRGWVALHEGELDQAMRDIEQGLALWHGSGTRMLLPLLTTPLALAHRSLGRWDDALRILDEAERFIVKSGELWWLPEVYTERGLTLEARDGAAVETALAAYREALSLADGKPIMQLRAGTQLARVLGARGEAHEARAILQPIAEAVVEGRDTRDPIFARKVLEALT